MCKVYTNNHALLDSTYANVRSRLGPWYRMVAVPSLHHPDSNMVPHCHRLEGENFIGLAS